MRYSKLTLTEAIFNTTDISEFEDRIEEIRDTLIEGYTALSKEDIEALHYSIAKFDSFRLQAVTRLMAPLLEIDLYSQDAASIIKVLLQNPESEVRYAALEAISYALGEVKIADEVKARISCKE